MNKIGFCTGFATKPLFEINSSLVKRVAKSNYDYIEFPLMSIMELSEIEFDKLLILIESCRIDTSIMCNLFPSSIKFLNGRSEYSAIENYLERSFERCKQLDVNTIIFGSGKARNKGDLTKIEATHCFIETMKDCVLPLCKKHGIKILLEPLSYNECDFINTLDEASRIVDMVDSSSFGLMVDLLHMFNNDEPTKSLESNILKIQHVHISNPNRELPEVQFDEYMEACLDILKAYKYNRKISFESKDGNIDKPLILIKNYLS